MNPMYTDEPFEDWYCDRCSAYNEVKEEDTVPSPKTLAVVRYWGAEPTVCKEFCVLPETHLGCCFR